MSNRSEYLTALLHARNGRTQMRFIDLEALLHDATSAVELLEIAYDSALEGNNSDALETGYVTVTLKQREALCFAINIVTDAVELAQHAWQAAHENYQAERAQASAASASKREVRDGR